MSDEHCPECGAKITGKTGFCSECGAVTTSLINQIEETKKIEKNEIIKNTRKNYYHKPDKSHKMALIYSIFLPFFGNLYLRENIINLVLTIISILFIFANIIGLLTISDFYYHYNMVYIYVLWWIVSMITLIIFIIGYNKHKVYYKKDDKYSRESQLPNLFNKQYIKFIPFIIFILFLSVNIMAMNDTSDKTYENANYTLKYPHNYIQDGNVFHKKESSSCIKVIVADAGGNSLEEWKNKTETPITKYKGTISIDGVEGSIIDDGYMNYMFVKNDKVYLIVFEGDSYNDNATIINSFKFK